MDNPRPEKVAVVDEVRDRFSSSEAVLLTEYRGINVSEMGELRRALRQAGGEFKVFKNTLVRFATRDLGLDLDEILTGPTAIAFVPVDGPGDPVMVAKALRDFARGNPNLVVKGGVLGAKVLGAEEAKALAEVAPREELLARFAGLMAAPMQQFAGLLQAVPQRFAYALSALIDQGGAPASGSGAATAAADAADAATAAPETTEPPTSGPDTAEPTDSETPAPAADEATADTDPAPVEES